MLSDFLVFPTTIKTLGVEGASSTSWSGFREFGGNRPQLHPERLLVRLEFPGAKPP